MKQTIYKTIDQSIRWIVRIINYIICLSFHPSKKARDVFLRFWPDNAGLQGVFFATKRIFNEILDIYAISSLEGRLFVDWLLLFCSLENFSPIWRQHHHRYILRPTWTCILGPLNYWSARVHWGPVTFTPVTDLLWNCDHICFNGLGLF